MVSRLVLTWMLSNRRDVKRIAWATGAVDTWDELATLCAPLDPAARAAVARELLAVPALLASRADRAAVTYDVPPARRALFARVHVASARWFLLMIPTVVGTTSDPFGEVAR
jgi:hypothetical protein